MKPTQEQVIAWAREAGQGENDARDQLQKEYERGFIDGMQEQMRSSVDKAVNAMSKPQVQQRTGNCLLTGVCAAEGHQISKRQYEQKPVAYLCENAVGHKYFRRKKPPSEYKPTALYTAPPQREWQGLTEDEYEAIRAAGGFGKGSLRFKNIFEAIETQLKEKNT